MTRRVVITGMGGVTAFGENKPNARSLRKAEFPRLTVTLIINQVVHDMVSFK